MGTAKRETGDFDAAIELYSKAISFKPDYSICMDNLGIAFMRTGRHEEAKGQFEKASAADPAYADAKFNLGVLYELYIKDIPAAVKAFEEYLALSKDEAKKEEVKSHLEQIGKEAGPR
jgi:tetratricopeptide (TPR) repeat protein